MHNLLLGNDDTNIYNIQKEKYQKYITNAKGDGAKWQVIYVINNLPFCSVPFGTLWHFATKLEF